MLYTRRLLQLLLRTVVTGLLVPVIVDILWGCSKPSGLRCPIFAARGKARLQKADRIPLALSRFLLRTAEGACKNRSAAPNTAPCFVRRTRSLCLPLLRFGCFCRRQRLSCAALHPFIGVPPAAARHPPFGGSRPSTAPSGCKLRSSCTCPSSLTASVCLPSEKVVPGTEPPYGGGPAGPGEH